MKRNVLRVITVIVLEAIIAISLFGCNSSDYKKAMNYYNNSEYESAIAIFEKISDYEDSSEMIIKCKYDMAMKQIEDGDYENAKTIFKELAGYENSSDMVKECDYKQATKYMDEGKYKDARELFISLNKYKDSSELIVESAKKMFIDYVKANAAIISNNSKNLSPAQDDNLSISVKNDRIVIDDKDVSDIVLLSLNRTMTVDIDVLNDKIKLSAEENARGAEKYISYTLSASAELNMQKYSKGQKVNWNVHKLEGYNVYGVKFKFEETFLSITDIEDYFGYIKNILNDSGLGLTMKDIGFEKY